MIVRVVSKSRDEEADLRQQDNPLPVGPDDMVHLGAHSLPGQLGGAQARLWRVRASIARASFSVAPCARQQLTTSISVFEWPMLHTMEAFFIRSSWSLVTTFLFPVKNRHRSHRDAIKMFLCTVGSAVTRARDDDINLPDDLVQLDHSESIHAEADEEGRRDDMLLDR